ncbi:predicted protein [Histoplasma mississippiense (nom. inval.)]|uniref:predicted protein n=1 Tax=Ajellomyces capsulatus (strain NAm1 / WU24) TaxID=2059318 RepID=UPI000157C312|nr:predicted protein [Histoplasma mississippiense (nom. inval.)]EDN07667.1 predicted protein [Histoplasma mississippiense (nom. inval.)]
MDIFNQHPSLVPELNEMQLVPEGLQEAVCRVAALAPENDKLLIRNTLLKKILTMCNLYQTELEVQKKCQHVKAAQQ